MWFDSSYLFNIVARTHDYAPKPRAFTPAASCPNMNDKIQIEVAPDNLTYSGNVKKPIPTLSPEEEERFWCNVEKGDSCWLWTGGKFSAGYGYFKMRGKPYRAHRVSYQLRHGPLSPTLFALHRCDVRNCVNPDHLFLGTHDDNQKDKERKGRGRRLHGKDNPQARLTEDDVREIRTLFETGKRTRQELAENFKVHPVHVWHIIHRKTWAHIK